MKSEFPTLTMRRLTLIGCALALVLVFATTQADAQRAHFRYVGGRWAHSYRAGWHRYWGGPTIGFYYAPAPVYIVPGYAAPSYYVGPRFWYANPSFGLSLNFGGGGGYYGGGHYRSIRSSGAYYGAGHYGSARFGGSQYARRRAAGGIIHGGVMHSGGARGSGRGRQ